MQSTSSQPTHTLPWAALAWETLGFLCYRGRGVGRNNKKPHKFNLSYLKINREHVLPVQGTFNGRSLPTSSGRGTGDRLTKALGTHLFQGAAGHGELLDLIYTVIHPH